MADEADKSGAVTKMQESYRGVSVPSPVPEDDQRTLFGYLTSIFAWRRKADAATGAVVSKIRFAKANSALLDANKEFTEKLVELEKGGTIAKTVANEIDTVHQKSERKLNDEVHGAKTDQVRYQRELVEEKLRLAQAEKLLQRIQNPIEEPDPSLKIAELSERIDELTESLGDETLSEKERHKLITQRRVLMDQKEALEAVLDGG